MSKITPFPVASYKEWKNSEEYRIYRAYVDSLKELKTKTNGK